MRGRTRGAQNFSEECRYNDGVICREKDGCAACGWSPAVQRRRIGRLRMGNLPIIGKRRRKL